MKKAEPNEQLGISTLGFVFAHVAHLRRFMHPETKHQALYSHFFGDASRSVLWGGLSRHQSKESSKRKTSSIKTFVMIHRTFVQSFRV